MVPIVVQFFVTECNLFFSIPYFSFNEELQTLRIPYGIQYEMEGCPE